VKNPSFCGHTFIAAFRVTIPVLLGYLAIGMAFGLMMVSAGYHWALTPLMSILIYAGAGQYIAVSLFVQNASLAEIAIVTLLVNARHVVYGLSLLEKFKNTRPYTWYMIFALTDETYALQTSVKVPPHVDRAKFYFYISLLDHIYWIVGSILGAIVGSIIHFNTTGLGFALTALFVVLMIEQIRSCDSKIPFFIATLSAISVLFLFGKQHMLILSVVTSIILLFALRRRLPRDAD
jgi:4-azaleucine resistance transporter AzlC